MRVSPSSGLLRRRTDVCGDIYDSSSANNSTTKQCYTADQVLPPNVLGSDGVAVVDDHVVVERTAALEPVVAGRCWRSWGLDIRSRLLLVEERSSAT